MTAITGKALLFTEFLELIPQRSQHSCNVRSGVPIEVVTAVTALLALMASTTGASCQLQRAVLSLAAAFLLMAQAAIA